MSSRETKSHSAKEMRDALRAAGDRARVQAHLLSLDAKARWQELESGLFALQAKVEEGGEKAAAVAAAKYRELTQALKELVDEMDGKFDQAIPVQRLMRPAPSTCSPDDRLSRAAQVMWEVNCGSVPVTDADGKVVGIITDRDICMAAYTRGQTLASMTVSSAMSKDVHSCTPEDSVGHVARLMASKQVRRIPVVDSGRLVGLLTLADIARHVRKADGASTGACVVLAHTLADISEERAPVTDSARTAAE